MGISRADIRDTKRRKLKVGTVYLVKSFAGPEVHMRVTEIENQDKGIYMGILLKKSDIESLIKAGVPYDKNEDPEKCTSVIYEFQVVKMIRNKK